MERTYNSRRAINGAIGAHISWAHTVDRQARTEAGRRAAAGRFERMVPAEITDPVARAVAAEHLRKAHMLKMAAASARSRRNRARKAS